MNSFKFNYYIPTKLLFGAGRLAELPDALAGFGNRALVVSGVASARSSGILARVLRLLEDCDVESAAFEGMPPNPSAESVAAAAKLVHDFRPDFILAVGGASVMDASKAVSLAATHTGDFWEYRITGSKSIGGIQDTLIPVVVVTTAGGTGGEVSPAAIITRNGHKEVIVSPFMYPRLSIVDPELHITVPKEQTAYMGLDAFVQGLEAYVSANSTPFSDSLALESMRLALRWSVPAVKSGQDVEARSFVALAGILSSFAINLAGVGAIHALSDPLSGRYSLPHGLALALVLLAVTRFNSDMARSEFSDVSSLMSDSGFRPTSEDMPQAILGQLASFLEHLGVSTRLADHGIEEQDIESFAADALNPDMSTNPKPVSVADAIDLYRQSL